MGVAHVAQLVERVLGKDEVISSNLIMGSRANADSKHTVNTTRKSKWQKSNFNEPSRT